MGRIAVVGDTTSVAGFRPLGFAVFPLEDASEARALWDELGGGAYSVVFVTEPVYSAIEDLVAQTADRPLPAVTVIPGVGSAGGVGEAKLARAIERALGTTVLVTEEEEA
jgi:vacuolar-type H+-ATPase subunit F/Vma7